MVSVGFYHLTKTSLEQALPALLIRTMQINERGLVYCQHKQQLELLTESLWRTTSPIWLPHGCHTDRHQDGFPEWQPIWLTLFPENLNNASFLFLVGDQSQFELDSFQRVFDLFDGNDEKSVKAARERWKSLKQKGYALTYWKQGNKGWEQAG